MEQTPCSQFMDQARAAHALHWVQAQAMNPDIKNSELKSYLRRLPVMIQTNGFGQAVAFYYSKQKNNAYKAIYILLEQWICEVCTRKIYSGTHEQPKLLSALTAGSRDAYIQATTETQALLVWARRFGDALLVEQFRAPDAGPEIGLETQESIQ